MVVVEAWSSRVVTTAVCRAVIEVTLCIAIRGGGGGGVFLLIFFDNIEGSMYFLVG